MCRQLCRTRRLFASCSRADCAFSTDSCSRSAGMGGAAWTGVAAVASAGLRCRAAGGVTRRLAAARRPNQRCTCDTDMCARAARSAAVSGVGSAPVCSKPGGPSKEVSQKRILTSSRRTRERRTCCQCDSRTLVSGRELCTASPCADLRRQETRLTQPPWIASAHAPLQWRSGSGNACA